MNFFERFFALNLKDYGGADLPIGLILFCMFVGMIAATVAIQYVNAIAYKFIKALVRHKATEPENAKDLKSLGLSENVHVLFALRRENPILLRYIARAENASADEKIAANVSASDEENTDTAAEKPCAEEGSSSTAEQIARAPRRTEKEKKEEQLAAIRAARYYLSATNADHAKEILNGSEPTILHTLIYCSIFVILFFGLAWLLPVVLPLIS